MSETPQTPVANNEARPANDTIEWMVTASAVLGLGAWNLEMLLNPPTSLQQVHDTAVWIVVLAGAFFVGSGLYYLGKWMAKR